MYLQINQYLTISLCTWTFSSSKETDGQTMCFHAVLTPESVARMFTPRKWGATSRMLTLPDKKLSTIKVELRVVSKRLLVALSRRYIYQFYYKQILPEISILQGVLEWHGILKDFI